MSKGIETIHSITGRLGLLLKERQKRRARKSLLGFVEYTHPGGFRTAPHHVLVCKEIDNWLFAKEPYNLMISMPPRHCKSKLCSVYLPAFIFGLNPDDHIIAASYAGDLIEGMSRQCQRVMMSDEYREVFPGTRLSMPGLMSEDKTAIRRGNEFTILSHEGHYRCAGVGGGLTGHGAKKGIMDDLVKDREQAESQHQRERIIDWYKDVFRSRIEKDGRMLLLMTRWHTDDPAGWLIKRMKDDPEADQWKVLSLPATYETMSEEETEHKHPDDNRIIGEPLWPEEFDEKQLARIKATVGSYTWYSLYQQRPHPPGGAVIKRHWLQVIDPEKVPPELFWVRYWDLAVSSKTKADFTASGQMAVDQYLNIYIRKLVHVQEEWPVVKRMIKAIGLSERVPVGVEGVGTQKGFVQDLQTDKDLQGLAIICYDVDKDKLTRALPWVARAESGRFFIVRGKGVDEYIEEAVQFSGNDDTHDDQIDWTSGAYKMLAEYVEPQLIEVGTYA